MTEYGREWIAETDQRFGQRLRVLREDRGVSQRAMTAAMAVHGLNWHQTTVAKVEAGARPVRLVEALAVADALGVSLDDLLDDPTSVQARRRRAVELIARRSELGQIEALIHARMHEVDERLDAVADRIEVVEVREGAEDGEHPAAS